jgi:hypothetical protein
MALPNRMSLRPGLLWLTLNLTLIIQCLSQNNNFFNCTYPVRCFRVPPGVRVPRVEGHWPQWLPGGISAGDRTEVKNTRNYNFSRKQANLPTSLVNWTLPWSGDVHPGIINLGFTSEETAPVNQYEAEWAPEQVWTLWTRNMLLWTRIEPRFLDRRQLLYRVIAAAMSVSFIEIKHVLWSEISH